ncbi:APC amino acid permease [Gloeophyllum trabeum ATCC 11539]|uniref:APC amino acid permease n=1 Tax=Gloeophyllum trabeum (strain ATCC 11539 / FP-39264 / Madison 617) TaxID=670483 RepID=S7RDG1_GLOTA|nr:APC amino acid permease [Gloeophyllum trabeum ATCC 11539]EPQ52255.1 APC amino acid permease [Gloeophyllum trabeum ATCC 11539]
MFTPSDKVDKASINLEQEDARLRKLGVRRELKREFTKFSTLSFALGILGCSASIASTFNTPLLLGGPGTAIWAWFLGSFGCMAIAASVAELVSAYPTAGGIYTSTAFVVPSKYRRSTTFVAAWMTVVGQLATPASVTFALSQMIFAAVTIGTDGTFTASTGQVLGLYVGLNFALGILNSLPTKTLHRIASFYVYVNLFTTLAVIIAIPAAGRGNLASHKFVWNTVEDGSGWGSTGFAFLLGILSVQWTDYDAAAHLSEEVKNAAVATPAAIVSAGLFLTSIFGFFVNVSLCYGVRDLSTLPGPTQLVFAQILWDNLGKRGALALWSFVIILQTITAATCQLACIRSIYAISRDNALPDGRLFAKVWRVTATPVNAVICTVVVECLFGLLSLASLVAINAVFSITAVALDLSYAIPIVAKLYIRLFDTDTEFTPGPFYLGKWGYAVNVYAVVWTLLETGILIMPQVYPVTPATMNYAGPIMGGICGLSWLWYMAFWHRRYYGPGSPEKLGHGSTRSPSLEEAKEKGVAQSMVRAVDGPGV